MLTFLRKNQKSLVLIVSILVSIAFIWLYNNTDFERMGESTYGRIYGRTLTTTEVGRETRMFQLALFLGLREMATTLSAGAVSRNDAADRYVINMLVMRHEAEKLGIVPELESVRTALMSLPVFQKNGQFDPVSFAQFNQERLLPLGFTEQELEEVMQDNIRFQRLKELAGSPAAATGPMVDEIFKLRYGKVEPAVVRFDLQPLIEETEVSEQEITDFYEANKEHLNTEAKLKVRYAIFRLTKAQENLQGQERIAALNSWSEEAADMATAVLEQGADFQAIAEERGAELGETDWFTQAAPPEKFQELRLFPDIAFGLSEQDPYSDAYKMGEEFVLFELAESEPSRPLTLEEARPRIVEALSREKAANQLAAQAKEDRDQLQAALGAGKTWEEALGEAELEAEEIPAFSRMEPYLDGQDSRVIMENALTLPESQLSEFISTENGGVLIYMKQRLPAEEEQREEQQGFLESMLTNQTESTLFREWLRVARSEANFVRATL